MTIGLPETEEPLSSSSSSLRNAGVLVVDEDAAFQLGLKTFLSEYVGFEKVFTASSGDEALKLIHSEESINVVTLDYRMPGMTGIEVLEKLSEDTPRALTVLMLTGYPSDELEKQFRSYNSSTLITSQFLSKPVEFEKLEPIILQSYEDLKTSQRLTKTLTGATQDETAPIGPDAQQAVNPEIQEQLEAINAKLTLATTKIEEMKSSMPNVQGRFWMGVLKLLAVIALIWMAIPMNWALKLKEYLPTNSDPAPAISLSNPEPAPSQPAPEPQTLPDSPSTPPQAVPADTTKEEPAPDIPASPEPVVPSAPAPAPATPKPQEPANEPLLTPAEPASPATEEGQGRPL